MKEITNKPVPRQYEERFEEVTRGEEVLFIVVGDLDLKGKYADSMLVFTKNGLIAFDRSFDGGVCSIAYNEMESADVKRLYGNALFRVRFSNGKRKPLMRFSYAAAEVADAGAVFVNSLKEHGYSDEDAEVVKSVYLKQRSFCPKCGRKLPSPRCRVPQLLRQAQAHHKIFGLCQARNKAADSVHDSIRAHNGVLARPAVYHKDNGR